MIAWAAELAPFPMEARNSPPPPTEPWRAVATDLQDLRDALVEASLALQDFQFLLDSKWHSETAHETDEVIRRSSSK